MSQINRLEGGKIDCSQTMSFRFDGKTFQGRPGDTLASALLVNDVRLMGRSFKYHRPRGPLSAGSEEPNAIVELRAKSQIRGQQLRSYLTDCRPDLRTDGRLCHLTHLQ